MQFDPITLEILWSRLVAAVDESATALVRTSFSPNVREANDFACALLDRSGASLAENSVGIPSFVGILPMVQRHVLEVYPAETWRPGDVVITNDPWLSTGHLPDITILAPIFLKERLLGFAGNIAHAHDIGGALFGADAREVFEEGLRLPVQRLYRGGDLNETLWQVLETNVRTPEQVLGDLQAQIAATQVCGRRVVELTEEYRLDELDSLSAAIYAAGDRAMRDAIANVPDGEYQAVTEIDGYGEPTRICLRLEVRGDELRVDYDGTSAESPRGINSVMNYTYAYTAYALKCALDPQTPRNEGSYRAIDVQAPIGSILNARFPAAVNGRHLTAHFLYSPVFSALSDVLDDRIIADCGSTPNLRVVVSGRSGDTRFVAQPYANGGMGATPVSDGLACTCFPSNRSSHVIELMEQEAPVLFLKKEMLCDSGGVGQYRGGVGQRLEFMVDSDDPSYVSMLADRMEHPALGLKGGGPGSLASCHDSQGRRLPSKGRSEIPPRVGIVIDYPGGGGYGRPDQRDRDLVLADLADGLISVDGAIEYGLDRDAAEGEVARWRE